MKDLKTLCNINIPNSLHSLLESSILDIEGTIKDGDKINNADLNDILSTKSEELYNIIYDVICASQKYLEDFYQIKLI